MRETLKQVDGYLTPNTATFTSIEDFLRDDFEEWKRGREINEAPALIGSDKIAATLDE